MFRLIRVHDRSPHSGPFECLWFCTVLLYPVKTVFTQTF